MVLKYSFVIFCAIFLSTVYGKLPNYIHVCHRNDPELSRCILKSIEQLKPKLQQGIPEIGVPSLEPFVIPEMILNGGNRQTYYRGVARNVQVYGASNFEINKLKIDQPNFTFFLTVRFPALQFFADVDVNGRILLSPVRGSGQIEANATNVVGNAIIQAKSVNIDGKNRLQFDMDLDLVSATMNTKVHNLQAPPFISEIVNEALNTNEEELFRIVKPYAEQKAKEVLMEIINKIGKNFSLNEIFPA